MDHRVRLETTWPEERSFSFDPGAPIEGVPEHVRRRYRGEPPKRGLTKLEWWLLGVGLTALLAAYSIGLDLVFRP